jgi:hypothetical protein
MAVKLGFKGAVKVNEACGMPRIQSALSGWGIPMLVYKVWQTIVDGDKVKQREPVDFMGTWQPLNEEVLTLKPEGLRNWAWYDMHDYTSTLNLKINDEMEYAGDMYKVQAVKDYRLNGYVEYHLVKDYKGAFEL